MHDIDHIDSEYPSLAYLKAKAKRRMPGFAWDYLTAGCFDDNNLKRNSSDFSDVRLQPYYLRDYPGADLTTTLFGERYAAPFGIAPIGLQGLMWPGSCEILARAAAVHNLPFVLSTVGTADIETVAKLTDGKAWFQLYHPADDSLRDKLLERAWAAGIKTLVILADTPTFAYRPREIRNGLSIPPRMSLRNIAQMLTRPRWCLGQLRAGSPQFKTMKPYLPSGMSMKHLALFMNKTFAGRLNPAKVSALRERWQGNLVVKGIVNHEDADQALALGADGFIVSNHGGRQLDSGESTIASLRKIAADYRDKTTVMIDGGMGAGTDIANALACGAHFTFLGRAPMYGVCALGERGGTHTLAMLKKQLTQVLEQVGCPNPAALANHLITD
ncbi:MAG: alpha-hydroxy acid oxidase [Planctomycetota bacterium]|jgi:L-lactate dehydrogenase (cytochrome)